MSTEHPPSIANAVRPASPSHQPTKTRDAVKDIWGARCSTYHPGGKDEKWSERVDEHTTGKVEKWVQSACIMCSIGCGVDIGVGGDGKIAGVRGRADLHLADHHPAEKLVFDHEVDRVNKGRLGPKGLECFTVNQHKDRLTTPLIRSQETGQLEPASWDEAMELIVKKSKLVIDKLTGHGISFYTSGQLFAEEYHTLAMVGKGGLGTLHMDGNTRLCTATAAASMRENFGCDGQPGSYTDIDTTDCIFLVGHNPAATGTVLWSRIADRLASPNSPKLVVIDPRSTTTAQNATVHIAPRVGTNLAVLNGLAHLLIKNDACLDKEFIEKHTVCFDELKDIVEVYNPEKVEEISGVPQQTLRDAAKILGECKRLLSTALQGVYQSNQATPSACMVNGINMMRGMIGKPGCGIYQMNGQPTAQNNRETGCDGEFPGFRNHQNKDHMEDLARHWNLDVNKIPHWAEPTHIMDMLRYIEEGSIKMMWVSGTNPAVSLPDLNRIRSILSNPELFVVTQDIFLTETAQLSDVVLPAAMWGEKTGIYTNVDRTVHISHKAIEPPGQARSDLEIFVDYATRMAFKDKDGNPLVHWKDSRGAFEHWRKSTEGRPCDYSGLSYEKLTGGSGIQWPCNEENPEGVERLYSDGVFPTSWEYAESYGHDMETGVPLSPDQYRAMAPNGRAIFKAAHYHPAPEAANDEYPFTLATGRRVHHFHTRTKTGRVKSLQDAAPESFCQMNAEDAETMGLKDGELVVVRSRRGVLEVPLKIGEIEHGQVFVPFHYGAMSNEGAKSQSANDLTQSVWDPISKQPTFKSGAVSVTKAEEGVTIHTPHTKARAQASDRRFAVEDQQLADVHRDRHLEDFLALWDAQSSNLVRVLGELRDRMVLEQELKHGCSVMIELANRARHVLDPACKKYGVAPEPAQGTADALVAALFPAGRTGSGFFDVLMDLRGLHLLCTDVIGILTALNPVSAAMMDDDLQNAVLLAQKEIPRIAAWAHNNIKVKAPQALIVPALEQCGSF